MEKKENRQSTYKDFYEVKTTIVKPKEVSFEYYEHKEEVCLGICKITGVLPYGSSGDDVGLYLYQELVLTIITHEPVAILLDLRELTYEYGTSILQLLDTFSRIKIFGENKIVSAYIISDKNKYGLASLCNFDIDNPKLPFFYDFDEGYNYLYSEYNEI